MYTFVSKSCHGNTGCNTVLSTVFRDWVFPRGIAVLLNGRTLVTQSGNELHTQPSAVTCDCLCLASYGNVPTVPPPFFLHVI